MDGAAWGWKPPMPIWIETYRISFWAKEARVLILERLSGAAAARVLAFSVTATSGRRRGPLRLTYQAAMSAQVWKERGPASEALRRTSMRPVPDPSPGLLASWPRAGTSLSSKDRLLKFPGPGLLTGS